MLQEMNISKKVKEIITAPIPESLILEREGGGGKKLSYISGSTVTDILNAAFGYTWSWETKKEWVQESIPFFNIYTKAAEKDKVTNPVTGKKGTWENQGPVAHVLGTLTVWLKDDNGNIFPIKKDGYGSKSILGKQNDQESIFKAAGTDALKKAASLLGIGLELYRNENEQYYFDELNYEDPWTDEIMEQYKKELEFLSNYRKEYEVTDEELSQLVLDVTGTTYDIIPDNIVEVVDYIKSALEEQVQ